MRSSRFLNARALPDLQVLFAGKYWCKLIGAQCPVHARSVWSNQGYGGVGVRPTVPCRRCGTGERSSTRRVQRTGRRERVHRAAQSRGIWRVKYAVKKPKSLAVALKELEPFVRNGKHLRTGKPFKKFGDMRSREMLANWLLCAAVSAIDNRELTFTSDPVGGDGIICDPATGETWPTEHVMVPPLPQGEAAVAEA